MRAVPRLTTQDGQEIALAESSEIDLMWEEGSIPTARVTVLLDPDSLVLQAPVIQISGRGGMGITKGASSPTMSSTRSAGSGSCQAPNACPCSARPQSNVNASGKSRRTNSARFRIPSTCSGTSWLLRRVKEFFAVQVSSTRLSWWTTFVVIASLGVGVGSLLRGVSIWLPLGVELVGLVLWIVVKSLELRHLKIAQMPETTATVMATTIPAQSASDPGSSEDPHSINSMSSSSSGGCVCQCARGCCDPQPTEGEPSGVAGQAANTHDVASVRASAAPSQGVA